MKAFHLAVYTFFLPLFFQAFVHSARDQSKGFVQVKQALSTGPHVQLSSPYEDMFVLDFQEGYFQRECLVGLG